MADYLTIRGYGRTELSERRSRFIATVNPAENAEEAEAFIHRIREEYKDAAHNVWAYRINSAHLRCSDDGEPSGTAGLPVLDVLNKSGVEKAAIVITRYFGGILLGGGGLIRAYSAAAHLGIQAAGVVRMSACLRYRLALDYRDWGKVQNALALSPAVLENTAYDSGVCCCFHIEEAHAPALIQSLNDLTGGNAGISLEGRGYMEVNKPG